MSFTAPEIQRDLLMIAMKWCELAKLQIASLNVANDVAFNLSGLQTGAQVRLRVKLKVSTVGGKGGQDRNERTSWVFGKRRMIRKRGNVWDFWRIMICIYICIFYIYTYFNFIFYLYIYIYLFFFLNLFICIYIYLWLCIYSEESCLTLHQGRFPYRITFCQP